MIKLVVDSTCDIPQEMVEKYGIAVLPLQVTIENQSYRDGTEIRLEELYESMLRGIVPKTSQINLVETEELFRGICEQGDDLIYLSFSGEMSGTYQVAQLVAGMIREDYPQLSISVIDSEGGCLATGIAAMQAARWIADGKAYDEVVSLTKELLSQVMHLFTLDSLYWLSKGGRLMRPIGFVGDKLQLKPILDVESGIMHIVRIVRGRKNAINTLVQMLLARTKDFPSQLIGIAHANDPQTATLLEQMLHDALPDAKTLVLPIGCVLGSHLGIGGVGAFFLAKPTTGYDLLSETAIQFSR